MWGRVAGDARRFVVFGLVAVGCVGLLLVWVTARRSDALDPCTKTWNVAASVSGQYTTAANWTPSGVPAETDVACAGPGTVVVFASPTAKTVKGIQFQGSLDIQSTELRVGTTANGTSQSFVNALSLEGVRGGNSALNITGSLAIGTGGVIGSADAVTEAKGGTTTLKAGATFDQSVDLAVQGDHVFRNEGTVSWTAGSVNQYDDADIDNAGAWELPDGSSGSSVNDLGFPGNDFHNLPGGTLTKAASGFDTWVYTPLENDGLVEVEGDQLAIESRNSATAVDDGSWDIAAGAAVLTQDDATLSPEVPSRALGANAAITGGGVFHIDGGLVDLGTSLDVVNLTITGAVSSGSATVSGQLDLTGADFTGAGALTLLSSGTATVADLYLDAGYALENRGALTWTGGDLDLCGATLVNKGELVDATDGGSIHDECGDSKLTNTATGTFSTDSTLLSVEVRVSNLGTLNVAPGAKLRLSGAIDNLSDDSRLTGGMWNVSGTLQIDGAAFWKNAAQVSLVGSNAAIVDETDTDVIALLESNSGSLSLTGRAQTVGDLGFTNSGSVSIGAGANLTVNNNGAYAQSGGTTSLTYSTAVLSAGTVAVNGGTLRGTGTIDAATVQNGATVSPGLSGPGMLSLSGVYIQKATGHLAVNLDGTTPGTQYDRIDASSATLAGALDITSGYGPAAADTFNVVHTSPSTVTGTFTTLTGQTTSNAREIRAVYSPAFVTLTTEPTVVFAGVGSVVEGDSGAAQVTVPITLDSPSANSITVNWTTQDATATAGSDYLAASGVVTFAPGETAKAVGVVVNGDTTYEPDETFAVMLSSPVNAAIAVDAGTGTITNDDPAFVINDISVAEGNTGTKNATFTVTRIGSSALSASVHFATADGTASSPSDFVAQSGNLSFAVGQTSKSITIPVVGDVTYENDETFTVTLSSSSNAAIASGIGTATIVDNDAMPAVSINDTSVVEGDSGTTAATFTVTLTGATALPASVSWATQSGTAGGGTDYLTASGTLAFAPGETSKTINVLVLGDKTYESNETFTVKLSAPVNATVTAGGGVGTIVSDDFLQTLSINDTGVAEGNSGTTTATFTITRTGLRTLTASVNWATVDGTATAGTDYVAASGTVQFASGQVSKTVSIVVNGDVTFEPDETFQVVLSSAASAYIGTGTGTGTIIDDDVAPAPSLSIDDATVTEGNSGTADASFTVTRSGSTTLAATVHYATLDGTASSSSDYVSASGDLSFAVGETAKTVLVAVNGDAAYEGDETFTVLLSSPTNAAIGIGTGTGTITNDDVAAPTGVGAVAGDGQAKVSWTASVTTSPAITGYTVTSSPGSKTCSTAGTANCTVTGLTNGVAYTFTVTATNDNGTSVPSSPSSAVTPTTAISFADVPPGAPFYDDIMWLAGTGITTGYAGPPRTFHPTEGTSRQTIAAFLYRFAGSPNGDNPTCSSAAFTDVPASHPFCGQIKWLASTGITNGYPDGSFHPTEETSRQTIAAFLYRYQGKPNGDHPTCSSAAFTDVPASHPFCGEIKWLASTGITAGYADGSFKPTVTLSRQAVAKYLHVLSTL